MLRVYWWPHSMTAGGDSGGTQGCAVWSEVLASIILAPRWLFCVDRSAEEVVGSTLAPLALVHLRTFLLTYAMKFLPLAMRAEHAWLEAPAVTACSTTQTQTAHDWSVRCCLGLEDCEQGARQAGAWYKASQGCVATLVIAPCMAGWLLSYRSKLGGCGP